MGQCLNRAMFWTTGHEIVIELDRHQVRADRKVVLRFEQDDYMTGEERSMVQRLLTCATDVRALWIDLQWPSISLQRQILTLTSVLNSFTVNQYANLQILSVRLEGLTDFSVTQLCTLCCILEGLSQVQLELWLHTSAVDDEHMNQLIQHLGKVDSFQTVALTGMCISAKLLDNLADALRHKAVRRLMLGDLLQPSAHYLALLVNHLRPNQLEYLHIWATEGKLIDGFIDELDQVAIGGLRWLHLVAYDQVKLEKVPNELLMDMCVLNPKLNTVDLGYNVGSIGTGQFVKLIDDWIQVLIESAGHSRHLQIAYLNIQLGVAVKQLVSKHWPQNGRFYKHTDSVDENDWTITINWTDHKTLVVHNAHSLHRFASQSKRAHLVQMLPGCVNVP